MKKPGKQIKKSKKSVMPRASLAPEPRREIANTTIAGKITKPTM
jgi:hypothetical protein